MTARASRVPNAPSCSSNAPIARLPASERTAEREACIAARQIARNHGGDIFISSSPEGGARFTVHLPLHVETETVHPAVMAS